VFLLEAMHLNLLIL